MMTKDNNDRDENSNNVNGVRNNDMQQQKCQESFHQFKEYLVRYLQ